jgi:hypothetical protein
MACAHCQSTGVSATQQRAAPPPTRYLPRGTAAASTSKVVLPLRKHLIRRLDL